MLSELKTSKQKEQNSAVEDFHSATKQEVQKRWNARLRTIRSTENTFANKQIVKIWYVVTLTIAHWQSAWRNDWNSKPIKNRERWIYSSHVNEYGKPLDFWRKLHICNTYSIYFLIWATRRKASDISVSEKFLTILAMLGFAFASENCGGQNMIRRHCKFCFWSPVGAAVSWCSFCKVGREMISWTHNLPPCRAYKDKYADKEMSY